MLKKSISIFMASALIILQFAMISLAANEQAKTFDYAIAYSKASDMGIGKNATAVSVMEIETRRVIADTNADAAFKAQGKNVLLMVCYAAASTYKKDSVTVADKIIVDPKNNTLNLKEGMNVAVSDLVAAILYSNDINAAKALAVGVGGDEATYINFMNNLARRMGMKNTHYTNVTGYADDNQKTTAEDLMILSYYCYRNSIIADVTSSDTHYIKTNEILANKKTLTNNFPLVNTKSEKYNSNVFGIGICEESGGVATSLIAYATSKQKYIFVIRSTKNSCYNDIKNSIDFITKNYALVDIQKIIFELGEKATVKIGGEDVYFDVMKNTVSQSNVVVNLYYSKSVSTQIDNYTIEPPEELPAKVDIGTVIPGFRVMYSGKQVSTVSLSVKAIGEQEAESTTLGFTVYEKGTFVKPKQSFIKAHSWVFIVGVVAVVGIAVVFGVEKMK